MEGARQWIRLLADGLKNQIREFETKLPELIGTNRCDKIRMRTRFTGIVRNLNIDFLHDPAIRRELNVSMRGTVTKTANELPQGSALSFVDFPVRPASRNKIAQFTGLDALGKGSFPRKHDQAEQRIDELRNHVNIVAVLPQALYREQVFPGALCETQGSLSAVWFGCLIHCKLTRAPCPAPLVSSSRATPPRPRRCGWRRRAGRAIRRRPRTSRTASATR